MPSQANKNINSFARSMQQLLEMQLVKKENKAKIEEAKIVAEEKAFDKHHKFLKDKLSSINSQISSYTTGGVSKEDEDRLNALERRRDFIFAETDALLDKNYNYNPRTGSIDVDFEEPKERTPETQAYGQMHDKEALDFALRMSEKAYSSQTRETKHLFKEFNRSAGSGLPSLGDIQRDLLKKNKDYSDYSRYKDIEKKVQPNIDEYDSFIRSIPVGGTDTHGISRTDHLRAFFNDKKITGVKTVVNADGSKRTEFTEESLFNIDGVDYTDEMKFYNDTYKDKKTPPSLTESEKRTLQGINNAYLEIVIKSFGENIPDEMKEDIRALDLNDPAVQAELKLIMNNQMTNYPALMNKLIQEAKKEKTGEK